MCAVGLFAASAATWIHATVETTLQPITVDVAGSDAAPAVTALGLVAGAAAVASTSRVGCCGASWAWWSPCPASGPSSRSSQ
nr:Trp biosynthesis-associated membrane protein [Kocuria atrinae]